MHSNRSFMLAPSHLQRLGVLCVGLAYTALAYAYIIIQEFSLHPAENIASSK
jgi:hypothetical protein